MACVFSQENAVLLIKAVCSSLIAIAGFTVNYFVCKEQKNEKCVNPGIR